MGIHAAIDRAAVGLGAKFMPKYFREGIESPPVAEHLGNVLLEFPQIAGEGEYGVSAGTLVGRLDAAFLLARKKGGGSPTIIYHHGGSEIPYDYGFRRVFPFESLEIPANLFLVRAPFHRSLKDFQQGIRTLANVVAMLAVSVRVIEQLVRCCRGTSSGRVLVCGTSLGGFITNLHHIHEGSADLYIPLLAGLAMNDVYLRSVYRKAVDVKALENPGVIESVLDFTPAFAAADNRGVFPLLARFDQLVRYGPQKASYGDCPVETIEKGHTTGALSYEALRRQVVQFL